MSEGEVTTRRGRLTVGHDGLQSSEESTEKGENESPRSEGVVAVGREDDPEHDGEQGEVGVE